MPNQFEAWETERVRLVQLTTRALLKVQTAERQRQAGQPIDEKDYAWWKGELEKLNRELSDHEKKAP